MSDAPDRAINGVAMIAILIALLGTIIGLAATDLVLPAVTVIPDVLGGTQAEAQFILGAYIAGTSIGLILWGEAGAKFDQLKLMMDSLLCFSFVSLISPYMPNTLALSTCRLAQGLFDAAPTVFAPVWIRAVLPERYVVQSFGMLASFESLTPAFAPILGLWLLSSFGWSSSFYLLGGLALITLLALIGVKTIHPSLKVVGARGSYVSLIRSAQYMRYGLSQAASLSGLLIFVFGMPAVTVHVFELKMSTFISMQVIGIVCFIFCANTATYLVARFSAEGVILVGSSLSALAMLLMWSLAAFGVGQFYVYVALLTLVNAGLGMRGPPGFNQALQVSDGNEARAAGLLLFSAFLLTAMGTAVTAAFVEFGMLELLAVSFGVLALSPAMLITLKRRGLEQIAKT
ncbi:MAG: MFS transporter [Pseudomonadota bacterium]